MNVRLLKRIAKVIQEKPGEFDIAAWHEDTVSGEDFEALCELPRGIQTACTTTHCIAGWAQVLSPDRDCSQPAQHDAKRLLRITRAQADRLFFASRWPNLRHGRNPTPEQAADRIERFIKTKGAE